MRRKFIILSLFGMGLITKLQAGPPANDATPSTNAIDVNSIINTCSAAMAYNTGNVTGITPATSTGDPTITTCGFSGNRLVWYKFTATSTGFMDASVKTGWISGTNYGTLATYGGGIGIAILKTDLTQLACGTVGSSGASARAATASLTSGTEYWIAVWATHSWDGNDGSFTMCLNTIPTDDFCVGATDVSYLINSCSNDHEFTTSGSSAVLDNSSTTCCGASLANRWYKFKTTSSGKINIKIITDGTSSGKGNLSRPIIALWSGSCGSLTQLACQNTSSPSGCGSNCGTYEIIYTGLTANSTYYFTIDECNWVGDVGSFTLCLGDGDYDWYQYATVLSDLNNWCSSTAAFTNSFRTLDGGEGTPSCWNGHFRTVWFKFTAISTSATIQLDPTGGTLALPQLALWNNASPPATPVRQCAYSGTTVLQTITDNSLVIGDIYYVSVDCGNWTGNAGTFKLCINNMGSTQYYSRASGNWSDPNTWSSTGFGEAANLGSAPGKNNIVNIDGYTITSNSSTDICGALNITNTTGATTLIVTGASTTLDVRGKMAVTSAASQNIILNVVSSGTLTILDNAVFTRTAGDATFQLNIGDGSTSGTLNVGKDLSWVSSGASGSQTNDLTMYNASAVNISRDLLFSYTGGNAINQNINSTSILTVSRDISFTSTAASKETLTLNNTAQLKLGRNFVRGASPSTYGKIVCNSGTTIEFNGSGNSNRLPDPTGSGGDGLTLDGIKVNNSFSSAPHLVLSASTLFNGNIQISGNSILNASAYDITLQGNWTNNSGASSPLSYSGSQKVTFTGNGNKVIGGTPMTFNNITINKSGSASVTLNANTSLSSTGVLTLTAGNLILNSYTLTINNGATTGISAGSTSTFIESENENSKVIWNTSANSSSYTFPFGYSNEYLPTVFSKNTSTANNISISTWHAASNSPLPSEATGYPLGNESNVSDRWWTITPSVTASSNITFKWHSTETVSGTTNTSYHFNSSTHVWEEIVGTAGTNSVTATWTSYSGGGGGSGGGALPLSLISFDAIQNEGSVLLEWKTAIEVNNDYFTLEKSQDGINFILLDTIDGAGSSSISLAYSSIDATPFSGTSYYRLSQTDFDGTHKNLKTVSVNFSGIEIISTFPNPAEDEVKFLVNTSEDMHATYTIYDIKGLVVLSDELFLPKGLNNLFIDVSPLTESLYFIKIISDDNKYYVREHFVKN